MKHHDSDRHVHARAEGPIAMDRPNATTDPVCGMTVEPARAAASVERDGRTYYFCSIGCRDKFLGERKPHSGADTTTSAAGLSHAGLTRALVAPAGGYGALAAAALLAVYFGLLTLVSGWAFTLEQFAQYWPYVVALALGFGVQIALYVYLRRAMHGRQAAGKIVAVSGTTSGAAMVSCCTHYLANLAPVLGATGLVTFVGQYQVELFWVGLAANAAGMAYIGQRVWQFTREARA